MKKTTNNVEQGIIRNLDQGRDKEKLYKRAYQTIKEHTENPEEFSKNMIYVNLGIAELQEDSRHMHSTTLNNKIKKIKQQKNKLFNNSVIAPIRNDDEASGKLLDEYDDALKNVKLGLFKLQKQHSYERSHGFKDFHGDDKKLTEKLEKFNIESFFFNKIYEMMLVQLIEAKLQNIDQHTFNRIKVYKTTTFDDCISGTDFIVSGKKHHNKRRSNIAVDHICGGTESSINNKGGNDKTLCREFCSSIGNGKYAPMTKIVWNSHPKLSFLLFDRYIKQLVTGSIPDGQELIDQYGLIKKNNPKLYQESVNNSNRIQDNTDKVQEALIANL